MERSLTCVRPLPLDPLPQPLDPDFILAEKIYSGPFGYTNFWVPAPSPPRICPSPIPARSSRPPAPPLSPCRILRLFGNPPPFRPSTPSVLCRPCPSFCPSIFSSLGFSCSTPSYRTVPNPAIHVYSQPSPPRSRRASLERTLRGPSPAPRAHSAPRRLSEPSRTTRTLSQGSYSLTYDYQVVPPRLRGHATQHTGTGTPPPPPGHGAGAGATGGGQSRLFAQRVHSARCTPAVSDLQRGIDW